MTIANLEEAMRSVDWSENVERFLSDIKLKGAFSDGNYKLALWSRQIERIDAGSPALCFVREMQSAGHYAAALAALSLYKPASASIRSIMECALYYTYFVDHSVELETISRSSGYWIGKKEIVEFHKIHTKDFSEQQSKLNLIANLERIYKSLSAIVHGQVPGVWSHKSFKETKFSLRTASAVADMFLESVDIINSLFLCTFSQRHWDEISPEVKRVISKGMSSELRKVLNIDRR